MDLSGKVVLVTGGARGIGAVIARGMAEAGAEVILHFGHDRVGADAIAASVGENRCHVVEADFMSEEAVSGLWQAALSRSGRIDILVNNAGVFEPSGVDDGFDAWSRTWHRTLQINLVATAHLCRDAVRHFRDRDGGVIINIASRAAFRGDSPDYMHYAASKGGMVALTRSIARGFAKDGILAYVIAPGFVRTEMAEDFIRRFGEEAILGEIPMGDMAPAEEVANLAIFLASGQARHATGTTIDINGASYVR